MAGEGTQEVIITDTVRIIMVVGTADGGTGTIPEVIGGDLGSMLTRVGGGPILIPIPTPLISLRQRLPSSPPRIANRSNSNLTTGTTARTRRATIRTSKAVREAGPR